MTTKRRPALIFDFGNVLAHFDFTRAGEVLGKSLGMKGDQFVAHARERGWAPVVQEYERGRMSSETFSETVRELMSLNVSHEEFAAAWSNIFTLNEPIAELVSSLKRSGFTLVLGSNTNHLHATHFREQFQHALRPFDRLILSFEIGYLKPEIPFYLACAAAAQSIPEECIFIDDIDENARGAREAGLRALVYRDTATLIDELGQLGIELSTR